MLQRAKKRIGRPPGRKAPPTPVLSQRVPQELYDMIKNAARTGGRTMGEEMLWRVALTFEWQAAGMLLNAEGARDALEGMLALAAARGVQLAQAHLRGEGGMQVSAEVIQAKGE